jgi:Fe-S cluster assembly scaffold protein SufB
VPDWYVSDKPLHFCFILDSKWTKQAVQPTWYIWKNAKIKIFAYCFGLDYEVTHGDWKKYYLEEGAQLEVYEFNYNSQKSYMKVYNTFYAQLKNDAFFKNVYISTVGHLGHSITRWIVECIWENSKAEIISKSKILDKDISDLNIEILLKWKNASWIIQSKSVTYEGGKNIFNWKIIGEWDFTKWHIECDEISLWNALISTTPQLIVKNPTSRLTHEAAVGSIERKSIENLLVKWFTKDEAIDFIVKWILD